MVIDELANEFRIVGLSSDDVEIRVVPQLGSKICSLRNRRTGREWMWSPPGQPLYFANRTGDAFADSTLIGADECLPTIAACRWQHRDLTDHGEVWTEAWELDAPALAEERIVTRLRLPISPLAIERSVQLFGERVNLCYTLKNVGDDTVDYIWALHPMMAIEDGDRLHLPLECDVARLDATVINCDLGQRGDLIEFPQPAPGIRLDSLDFGREFAAVKFFTEPVSLSCAGLRNERNGDYLVYSTNPAEINTFGVWINRGGWSGYHHVAIEPTNGAPDALDLAVSGWRRFSSLQPGEVRHWAVDIYLGTDLESTAEDFLDQFSVQTVSDV